MSQELETPKDEMCSFEVEISQEDISQGKKGNPDYCPVALAMKRRFNTHVVVVTDVFRFMKGESFGGKNYFKLPPEASQWIADFDHLKEVQPITFKVEIPKQFVPPGVEPDREEDDIDRMVLNDANTMVELLNKYGLKGILGLIHEIVSQGGQINSALVIKFAAAMILEDEDIPKKGGPDEIHNQSDS
jgi:hypothetical protein